METPQKIMKKTLSFSILALFLAGSSYARTWTSSDGAKTFEGDFVSADADTVTVSKNGRNLTFKLALLSEADQEWTKEAVKAAAAEEANAAAAEEFPKSDLGKFLKDIQKFDGKKYQKTALEGAPEYFVLYYSASW